MMRWPSSCSRPVVSVSRTIWRNTCSVMVSSSCRQLPGGCICQLIGAFIFRVSAVPPYPLPANLVALLGLVKPLPQLGIPDRLSGRRPPAVFLPVCQPFSHAFADVLRIGGQHHITRAFERLKGPDGGHQIHAIVVAVAFVARQHTLVAIPASQLPPAARPPIYLNCIVRTA